MSAGSYEDELRPIRGDVLLDKIFGWLTLTLTVVVFGTAIWRLTHGGIVWLESVRIFLIALAIAVCLLTTTSTEKAFRWVIYLSVIRLIGAIATYPWDGGPRYWGSEVLFDLVAIGYAKLRIRTLTS